MRSGFPKGRTREQPTAAGNSPISRVILSQLTVPALSVAADARLIRFELICRYFDDPVCATQSMETARCRGRKAGHCIFGAGVNSAPAATRPEAFTTKQWQGAIAVSYTHLR